MKIGEEFNYVMNNEVLTDIARAAASLHAELLYLGKNEAKEIVEELLSDSQKVVNCYIEQQKTTLMNLIDSV